MNRDELLKLHDEVLQRVRARSRQDENGCWVWQGALSNGYAEASWWRRGPKRVPRYILETQLGRELNRDELVCHTCDNRRCVNPSHLFLGSSLDNAIDCVRKDRHGRKLNWTQVKKIRRLNDLPAPKVAARFGVSTALIWQIRNRKVWRYEPQ